MTGKPYPKYKPSGVEWLGEVPEHWQLTRLDFSASVKARLGWRGLTADEYVQEGFIFLSTPNIKGEADIDFVDVNFISEERYLESPEIMLRVGDLVLAKDGSTLGTVNRIKSLPAPATVNSSLALIRPKTTLESEFLFRWISSPIIQSLVEKFKDGQGVPHLFQADIRKFLVPLPPLPEQQAIAAFLDHEASRLDILIAKKKRLTELLAEQRAALISRAVSKGMNSKVKLKNSGLEWLGNVPEHWEIKRLRFIGKAIIGLTYSPEDVVDEEFEGEKFLVLRSTNIQDGKITLHENVYVTTKVNNNLKVRKGDILICARNGSRHLVGKNALIVETDNTMTFGAFTTIFRSPVNRFLFYFFASEQFQYQATGFLTTTINQLTNENLNSILATLPPLPEQQAIATYLDIETAKIDALVAKVEEAIGKLQEYRTALISAAVTGKIDVRDAV